MNDVEPIQVTSAQRPRRRWLDRAMVLLFLALVAVPLFGLWPNQEQHRWQAAALLLDYQRDADPAHLRELIEVTQQLPDDTALRLRVVELLLKKNWVAEADPLIRPLAEQASKSTRAMDWTSYQVLRHYATLLWLRGEDQASLEVVKQIEERLPRQARGSYSSINEICYQRALTQLELDAAENEMYGLIYRKRAEFNRQIPRWLTYRTTVVVAGTLLAHDVGLGEQTLDLLEVEINLMRESAAARTREWMAVAYGELKADFPFSPDASDELDRVRQYEAQGRCDLAALLIARAYLLDQLQRPAESQRDRREVHGMQIDADAWLAATPNHQALLQLVSQGGSLLDTYAYILYGQRRLSHAIREQQVAIWALKLFVASYDSPLQNTSEVGLDVAAARSSAQHSLAVLYAHHAEMLEAAGLMEKAEQELKKVEELGYNKELILF
ncbi:MAG TPA: hypothetical protein PKD54_05195 [Pirellulaceae bacterium]|nr:hypothetical protein [Pirellulaceae bacterium]